MRFTVKLDDDVAAGIKSEMERTGQTLRRVINRLIRKAYGVPGPPDLEKSKSGTVKRRRKREK
jgi:hypothetical protein